MHDDELDVCLLKHHLFGGFEDRERSVKAEAILRKLSERYGNPVCGRNRATFMLKKHVLKFPLNPNGEADNDWEASCSGPELAKGRWLEIDGFICVMQEKLVPVNSDWDSLPDWTHWIDGQQVGYSAKGVLKAYDFGMR